MLFICQLRQPSTYVIGRYEVEDGFYGPVNQEEALRFQCFEGQAQVKPIGRARDVMLKLGVIKPDTDEEREIVQKHLETLFESLGMDPAENEVGDEFDFDDGEDETEDEDDEEEGGQEEGGEEPSGEGLPQGDVEVTPSEATNLMQQFVGAVSDASGPINPALAQAVSDEDSTFSSQPENPPVDEQKQEEVKQEVASAPKGKATRKTTRKKK